MPDWLSRAWYEANRCWVMAALGLGFSLRFEGGRHIRYPENTPLNNLLVSLLAKAGVQVDQFGDSTGVLADI